jgi:hypothetical protein
MHGCWPGYRAPAGCIGSRGRPKVAVETAARQHTEKHIDEAPRARDDPSGEGSRLVEDQRQLTLRLACGLESDRLVDRTPSWR